MGLMRVGVVLCVSSMLLLDERADCTTHPRVKMYGPKVTVIDRRKPEANRPDAIVQGEVKIVPEPPPAKAAIVYPDEPSCLELRLLWRSSQLVQNRMALQQSANSIVPMPFDPFVFSAWDEYVKPRYANSRRKPTAVFERAVPPDRYHIYRQLRPFEKIARLATTTRAIMEDRLQPRKGANLFRLGFPLTKIPVISMRLTAKDRFEELKEILRLDKTQQYRTGAPAAMADDDGGPYSVVTVAETDAAGKKRPVYETLMSRPRHFSQGHYMNVKPGGGDVDDVDADDNPNATDSPQYKSSPLVKSWNSRW